MGLGAGVADDDNRHRTWARRHRCRGRPGLRGHDVLGVDVDRQRVAQLGTWTPPTDSGSAELGQVRSALSWTRGRAYEGLVVVMKSTVPPGTTA